MVDAFLGGLASGMASAAYLFAYSNSVLGKLIAAICFSVTMMAIPYYKLDFFLGRPGLLSDKNNNTIDTLIVFMGNFVGVTWIALLVKLFPEYNKQMEAQAEIVLQSLHSFSWVGVLMLSIFAGAMFYAGTVPVYRGQTPIYFALINLVCIYASWPTFHFVYFCLSLDLKIKYWYLVPIIIIGNTIGSNIWITLRKHSSTYKNKDLFTPDSYDIVDKFHDFV